MSDFFEKLLVGITVRIAIPLTHQLWIFIFSPWLKKLRNGREQIAFA